MQPARAEHLRRDRRGRSMSSSGARDELLDGRGLVGRSATSAARYPSTSSPCPARWAIARRSSSIVASSSSRSGGRHAARAGASSSARCSSRARRRRAPTRGPAAPASRRGTRLDSASRYRRSAGYTTSRTTRARARGPRPRRPSTGDGMTASSIGVSTSRRSWSIVRSATIRAAVRPDARASWRISMFASMNGPYARSRSSQRSRPSGRVGVLERRDLRQQRLGPVDLVHGADLVRAQRLVALGEAGEELSMPRVTVLDRERVVGDRPRRVGCGADGPICQPARPSTDRAGGRRSGCRCRPSRTSGSGGGTPPRTRR